MAFLLGLYLCGSWVGYLIIGLLPGAALARFPAGNLAKK
jgi:hypothetical protein